MSRLVHVDLGARSYDIHIGHYLPIGTVLSGEAGTTALVVSDSNVEPLYGNKCVQGLGARGLNVTQAVVPAGEVSKSLRVLERLYDKAMEAGVDRSSIIIALGGGMVGDLAGFLAATLLRGVRFIQVPTTLLAMVDSSVGGKTGINLPQGKNLVGAFHQPIEVVADISTLKSLPDREYVSGLAEVVKYGVIWDAVLFKQIEETADKLLARDPDALEPVIGRCCEIKAEVVKIDERESGVRSVLNFGHTLGHALEKVGGYGERLHGEAVAVGMAYAARLSMREKAFPPEEFDRLTALLRRFNLPISLSNLGMKAPWREVRNAMSTDKKTVKKTPRFVLAQRLGSVVFGCEVAEDVLEETWKNI
jgi:3-dehydroquinate synthase